MTDYRIMDISEEPAKLNVRNDQLIISIGDDREASAPLSEIAALVVSNPQVSYSHAALAGLAREGAALIVCDEKRMPAAMMMPIVGHHLQAERFALQAGSSLPGKKNIWRQIIKAKVAAQGRLLAELRGHDFGLLAMAKMVKSGDPYNVEAQASRKYWPALFNDKKFKRDREGKDVNRFLNYGYAVLRAIVARSICASGLHPSLGVHHHNRYDSFCLADDLMEPFRPVVDRAVVKLSEERGTDAPMDRETKACLIGALMARFEIEGEQRSLFDISAKAAAGLARAFAGKNARLNIPEI